MAQTSRDQLQAHRFTTRRLVSALLLGDAGAAGTPTRRGTTAVIVGGALLALAAAGFWIYGLVSPGGNTAWQTPGAIVLEKETGNRYVLMGNRLMPTLNQASALLATGGAKGGTVTVSVKSLAGTPHGPAIGIPGAPDVLPGPAGLVTGPALVCVPGAPGGNQPPATDIRFGHGAPATAAPAGSALRVLDPQGQDELVAGGVRHRVTAPAALVALGYDQVAPVRVSQLWLDSLPAGDDIAPVRFADAGSPGPTVAGRQTTVGQLLTVPDRGGDRHYVVLATGLQALSGTAYLVQTLDTGGASTTVDAADVAAVPVASDDRLARIPAVGRPIVTTHAPAQWCVRTPLGGSRDLPDVVGIPVAATAGQGTFVALAPCTGLLAVPASEATATARQGQQATIFLVTEQGLRYALAGNDAITSLGLGGIAPQVVPDRLLDAIPAGPALSTQAAIRNGAP